MRIPKIIVVRGYEDEGRGEKKVRGHDAEASAQIIRVRIGNAGLQRLDCNGGMAA